MTKTRRNPSLQLQAVKNVNHGMVMASRSQRSAAAKRLKAVFKGKPRKFPNGKYGI